MTRVWAIIISIVFLIILGIWSIQKTDSYRFFDAKSINGNVKMSSFDGKYKIVYFCYMSSETCPMILQNLGEILTQMNDDNIIILFATLDPQRDTIQAIDSYVKFFYKNSFGIWFDEQALQDISEKYDLRFHKVELKDSAMKYSIAHTQSLYLFDKKGYLIGEIHNPTKETIQENITNMLKNH